MGTFAVYIRLEGLLEEMFVLHIVFLCIGLALANKCPPKPPTISEFNVTAYVGKWYEQRRIPAFFQLDTSCVMAEYLPLEDQPERISVFNVATKKNGDLTDILGSAYVPDPGNPAGDYWVLETVYTNYSIVYACQDYL